MPESFDAAYPNVAWWVETWGWIEMGEARYSDSLVRLLDTGGTRWESDEASDTLDKALHAAEAFIAQWRIENGCVDA